MDQPLFQAPEPSKAEIEEFVAIVRTFFDEIGEAARTARGMVDHKTHSTLVAKFDSFFDRWIPFFDPRGPTLRKRIGRHVPPWAKELIARSKSLSRLVSASDIHLGSKGARGSDAVRTWLPKSGLDDLARRVVRENLPTLVEGQNLARKLELDHRDVYVFLTHLFPTTWSPLVRALNDRGCHTVWCGTEDAKTSEGYGVLETSRIGTTTTSILSFLGVLIFLCSTRRTQILVSGECFYGSNWNAEDTTVLYTLLSCVLSTARKHRARPGNLTLLMYDGLKPIHVSETKSNAAITHYYKRLMNMGDRIIYNSNTDLLGSFNQYAIPLATPRLHFFRYSEAPVAPKPRIDWQNGQNIHMACITVCLGEFGEPSRDKVSEYVRSIVMQGIHFHYYCITQHPVIQAFHRSLGDYGQFLHLHRIIKDQTKLVEDLHQYHVGFNPSDHVPFAHGISSVSDRFYQDAMATFLQSTIGTSFLVYAAAGLPVMLPRGCTGATQLLGNIAIPIVFSEMHQIKSVLQECDLPRRLVIADAEAPKVHIDTHMHRFLDFFAECRGRPGSG
jgi:hypothetical protein